jgi:hypothetical protein
MHHRRAFGLVFFGWVLLHAAHDGGWQTIGDYPGSVTCERVRDSSVADEIRHEIGGALADQPADNPLRQQAWSQAERRVRERYRCEWRGT